MQAIDKSKLPPPPQRNVDPLNTVITVGKYVFFLVLPLLLAFGAKALIWMGLACVAFAIVRFINNPPQRQQPSAASPDPVAAGLRDSKQPSDDTTANTQ
ncbi:MAG TPA: hypothetical protein V6C76_07055 [Drouetiella sp.]